MKFVVVLVACLMAVALAEDEFKCADKETGNHAIDGDCKAYWECKDGKATKESCRTWLRRFNPEKKSCDWWWRVTCPEPKKQ